MAEKEKKTIFAAKKEYLFIVCGFQATIKRMHKQSKIKSIVGEKGLSIEA